MRFRLGTQTLGAQPQQDDLAGGIGRAIGNLAMLPLMRAQAAGEAQKEQAKFSALGAQQRQADAQAALYGVQADEKRQQMELQGPAALLRNAALMGGVAPHQLDEFTSYAQTGRLPSRYDAPGDGVGPVLPAPDYADPQRAAQIWRALGLTGNALAQGDKSVENVAKASGLYQQQDDVRGLIANPGNAGAVGQAYAAVEGKPLIDAIGNTGAVVNRFTGDGSVAERGLYALFGDQGRAEIRKNNAAAGKDAAQTRKINQEIEQGGRTGDLQVVTGADGVVTVVNKRTLSAQPVLGADGRPVSKGGPAIKPLTEGQAKANLFGARMFEADQVLTELEEQGVMRPGAIKGGAETAGRILGLGTDSMGGTLADTFGGLTNWTQSAEQQRVDQARRDFINAVLRKESGAVISPMEFANAEKQYFPQPGDSQQVIEQKRRNRQIATNLMLQEVPEQSRYRPGAASAPATPAAASRPGGATGSWGAPAAGGGWSIQKVN